MSKVKLRSYVSPTLVLLAMDWPDGDKRDDFLGFAIRRTPGFWKQKQSWLPNRIGFDGPPSNGKDLPSNQAPIQKFMWWDARIDTKDRGKTIRYEVIPTVKPWTSPKLMMSAAATIDVKISQTEENGIGTYFNRAVVSSQAFVKEFGTNPKGAKRDKALVWLANGIEQVIPAFIKNAEQIDCAIYHLTDQNWVIKALKAYGKPATVACHYKAPTAKTKGDTANERVMTMFNGTNIVFKKRTKMNLMHNKFVVRSDGNGSADAVLMGSANFTEEGLTSQANLLHMWDSPELAKLYQDRQKVLFADTSKAKTAKLAGWSNKIKVGDAMVRVYFPPEAKPGRNSIDPIVKAIKSAKSSVVFCLFSSTDQPLRDECFKAADQGKMMFGLVNSITLPKDPTKKDAQTQAMVEIYNRSRDDRDVFPHALFQRGKEPQGFWWEVATLRPKEPDTTADMVDAGVAPNKKKNFVPAVYIHHKFVVIDGETKNPIIYSGSANLSGNSCWNNDENLMEITGSPRLGQLYLAEFMRLYEHYRARAAYDRRVVEGDKSTFKLEKDPGWAAKYYQPGTPEFKGRQNMVAPV